MKRETFGPSAFGGCVDYARVGKRREIGFQRGGRGSAHRRRVDRQRWSSPPSTGRPALRFHGGRTRLRIALGGTAAWAGRNDRRGTLRRDARFHGARKPRARPRAAPTAAPPCSERRVEHDGGIDRHDLDACAARCRKCPHGVRVHLIALGRGLTRCVLVVQHVGLAPLNYTRLRRQPQSPCRRKRSTRWARRVPPSSPPRPTTPRSSSSTPDPGVRSACTSPTRSSSPRGRHVLVAEGVGSQPGYVPPSIRRLTQPPDQSRSVCVPPDGSVTKAPARQGRVRGVVRWTKGSTTSSVTVARGADPMYQRDMARPRASMRCRACPAVHWGPELRDRRARGEASRCRARGAAATGRHCFEQVLNVWDGARRIVCTTRRIETVAAMAFSASEGSRRGVRVTPELMAKTPTRRRAVALRARASPTNDEVTFRRRRPPDGRDRAGPRTTGASRGDGSGRVARVTTAFGDVVYARYAPRSSPGSRFDALGAVHRLVGDVPCDPTRARLHDRALRLALPRLDLRLLLARHRDRVQRRDVAVHRQTTSPCEDPRQEDVERLVPPRRRRSSPSAPPDGRSGGGPSREVSFFVHTRRDHQ